MAEEPAFMLSRFDHVQQESRLSINQTMKDMLKDSLSERANTQVFNDAGSIGGRSGFTVTESIMPSTAFAAQLDPQVWLNQELRKIGIDETEFRVKQKILLAIDKPNEFVPRENFIIDRKIAKILKLTKSR